MKSSEGFRLHKGVVRNAFSVPDIGECEKMCYSESKFRCSTFSYRYSTPSRDNCLLCDRSFNLLDYYADLEPDRNYDIYAMSDDTNICKKNPNHERGMATASSANERKYEISYNVMNPLIVNESFQNVSSDQLTLNVSTKQLSEIH